MFNKGYSQVAWIDNDAIVRKPLDGLWEGVVPNSIKVWYRKKKLDEYKLQTGVYVIGRGNESVKYCSNIIKGLEGTDNWLLPQLLMYNELNNMKLINMGDSFNDSRFKNGSHIWHCKANHFSNPKYQQEYRKYTNELRI